MLCRNKTFGKFHALNLVGAVWGWLLSVPTWLRTVAQSKVHKDVDEWVWCGRTWLACTDSWPQPDRAPFELIRAETVSQAFSFHISVWPHKWAFGRMAKNSHKYTPQPCGKLSHRSWSESGQHHIKAYGFRMERPLVHMCEGRWVNTSGNIVYKFDFEQWGNYHHLAIKLFSTQLSNC